MKVSSDPDEADRDYNPARDLYAVQPPSSRYLSPQNSHQGLGGTEYRDLPALEKGSKGQVSSRCFGAIGAEKLAGGIGPRTLE